MCLAQLQPFCHFERTRGLDSFAVMTSTALLLTKKIFMRLMHTCHVHVMYVMYIMSHESWWVINHESCFLGEQVTRSCCTPAPASPRPPPRKRRGRSISRDGAGQKIGICMVRVKAHSWSDGLFGYTSIIHIESLSSTLRFENVRLRIDELRHWLWIELLIDFIIDIRYHADTCRSISISISISIR